MRPKEKAKTHAQGLLEDRRLDLLLRMEHELVRLAEAIESALKKVQATEIQTFEGTFQVSSTPER